MKKIIENIKKDADWFLYWCEQVLKVHAYKKRQEQRKKSIENIKKELFPNLSDEDEYLNLKYIYEFIFNINPTDEYEIWLLEWFLRKITKEDEEWKKVRNFLRENIQFYNKTPDSIDYVYVELEDKWNILK